MKTENNVLFSKIAACHSRLLKRVESPLGSLHGLGISEYLVLDRLNSVLGKTMSRVELAEQVGMTASGVTRLLQPMEKIGLVEKQVNQRDARKSMVKLSVAGELKFKESQLSFNESLNSLFDGLSEKDRREFASILDRVK